MDLGLAVAEQRNWNTEQIALVNESADKVELKSSNPGFWTTGQPNDLEVHALHAEEAERLALYRCVLTGSHPEYWTREIFEARDRWLATGGRLIDMGGNGLYWVTGVPDNDFSLVEIRRYGGTRPWSGEPGEQCLALSGEPGGCWRDRGRAPQKTVGVVFFGQVFDRGTAYRRTAASPLGLDPRRCR